MASWAEFAEQSPEIAAAGQRLLFRGHDGEALLATVRGDEPPRIHPISVAIVGPRLCAFILPSAKRSDLARDGRYALHAYPDRAAPSEFSVRGRARPIADAGVRAAAADGWYFGIDDNYELFEFSIEAAVLGVRQTEDDWPPRYSSWKLPPE
jgi:hypothetical protein